MVVCGIGLTKINTSIKLTKLFSPDAEIIRNYEWLEENLGPLVPMEVVLKIDNPQCPLTLLERMELVEPNSGPDERQSTNRQHDVGRDVCSAAEDQADGPGEQGRCPRHLNRRLEARRTEYIEGGFLAQSGDDELWRISARVGALE